MSTAVVFVGGPHLAGHDGDPPAPDALRWSHPGLSDTSAELVVAADSGLHLALAVGWTVDRVVGDLDSVDPTALEAAASLGAGISAHPRDKDATDLELALDEVVAAGCSEVVVIGADAGRLDHLFSSLLVLCAPRYADVSMTAWLGRSMVVPVRSVALIPGRPGSPVSLLALHGPATGVHTVGLRWGLDDAVLHAGSGLGVSNQFVDPVARVSVDRGCIAVIVPPTEERP